MGGERHGLDLTFEVAPPPVETVDRLVLILMVVVEEYSKISNLDEFVGSIVGDGGEQREFLLRSVSRASTHEQERPL